MHVATVALLAALSSVCSASPAADLWHRTDELVDCLNAGISKHGAVILPDSPVFSNDTIRYSELYAPTFRVISQVGNEQDVRVSIQCAKNTSTPFFATGPRHGNDMGLQSVSNGLEILFNKFNQICVDPETSEMTVGGATTFQQVIDSLYAAQKQITTGSGVTVGIVGASLGAGIGRLEGLNGLIVDSLKSVRLMLPNTTVVEASEDTNPELFWGIRGAGFNFGMILNATYQVYDEVPDGMHLNADLLFPANVTKEFFERLRDEAPNMPAPLSIATATSQNATTKEFSFLINAVYAGPEDEGRKAIEFITSLSPILAQNISYVLWKDLIPTTFFGTGASPSTGTLRRSVSTVAFNNIDPDAQVKITQILEDNIAKYPQTSTSSLALYFPGTQAAKARPQNSTAYPWREVAGHMVFEVNYDSNTDDADVDNYYTQFRDTIGATAGTPSREVYVGFSHGDEPLEQLFSAENLPRLAALKKEFDPEGLFNAYHPLPTQYP